AYKTWKQTNTKNTLQAAQDSLHFEKVKSASGIEFSNEMWSALFKKSNLYSIQPNIPAKKQAYNAIGPNLYSKLKTILEGVIHSGIINRPKKTLVHNKVTVRD